MKANGKEPRARSLKRHMLTKNKSGKIVSKRKSAQASKQYHINNRKLKQWNEAAKRTLYVSDNDSIEFPMLDEDFDDDSPYVPFDPTSPQRPPRKSKRPKTPSKRPDFIYYTCMAQGRRLWETGARFATLSMALLSLSALRRSCVGVPSSISS
eukprot:7390328-Prymnesium_polylepis.1